MRNLRLAVTGLMVIVIVLNMYAKVRVLYGSTHQPGTEKSALRQSSTPINNAPIPVPLIEPTFASKGAELDSAASPSTAPIEAAQLAGREMLLRQEEAGISAGFSTTQVTVSAPHTTKSWDERVSASGKFNLPLLYLHRQREATPEADRTLNIHIAGLPMGSAIHIEAVSRHADVTTGERHTRAKLFVPDHPCTSETPCTIPWTFDPRSTYSDLYDLRVKDTAGNLLWEETSPDRPHFAMLDSWDVGFGEYTVRVTYAALFPFVKPAGRLGRGLAPAQVVDFIEGQLAPMIKDTWHTQMHAWAFGESIHADWDADQVVEIIITALPFALFDGTGSNTVFAYTDGAHYPERRLWWLATHNAFQAYDSLENGYKAVFAHEFFHLAQWNAVLSARCSTNHWLNVFMEAQGIFAPSVQHPELELTREHVSSLGSEYLNTTNRFLMKRLNTSYRVLEASATGNYDAALYWRFLYEQFNGIGVVRAALEEMACHYDPDIVAGIGEVMDRAFRRFDGPFRGFEESLIAFARANYALRLENGRCEAADLAQCGGFYYDPEGMYVDPPLEAALDYDGAPVIYDGAIPASFGMDFVEVRLDSEVHNRAFTVMFEAEGSVSRFSVEIWKLGPGGAKPRAVTPQPETMPQNQGGAHVYVIPAVDTTTYDRLALIITRLDPDESTDLVGEYDITLTSTGNAGN